MATSQRFPFFSFHEQVQSRASNQQQQQQQQEQTPAMASMGFPPVPMNIDLDPIFVRLPTGEQVPNQLFWGPYPLYRPWHYCAQHWNYLNYWYHSFGIHYAQGQSSSLWQTIHSRLGYVAAHDRAFDMVHNIDDSWDSWALDAPLSRGLRFLESLDLCCHTQGLVQLNNYFISTPYNPFGQAYRRIKPVQEYLEISTNYETTFVS
jgi:hypothetical protein